MDQDGDFSDYASARWGRLVRSAVFLGCNLEEAHDLVQTTLLRCYIAWRKVEKAHDRDAYVCIGSCSTAIGTVTADDGGASNPPELSPSDRRTQVRPTRPTSLMRSIERSPTSARSTEKSSFCATSPT